MLHASGTSNPGHVAPDRMEAMVVKAEPAVCRRTRRRAARVSLKSCVGARGFEKALSQTEPTVDAKVVESPEKCPPFAPIVMALGQSPAPLTGTSGTGERV